MPIGSVEKRQTLLIKIEEFARRRYRAVFLVAAIVLVGAGILGSLIDFDTEMLNLVPEGDRVVDAFKTSLDSFGASDYLAVMVEAPSGHGADEYTDFVDLFVEKLADVPGILQVDYRLGGSAELMTLFRRYALLFLPPSDLPALERILTDDAIRAQVAADRRILESPSSSFMKDLVQNDPLGLGPLLWNKLVSGQVALRFNPEGGGYYLSADGSMLLVLVKPEHPAQNIAAARQLVASIKGAGEAARAELAADGSLPGVEDVTLDYAGIHIIALNESDLIMSDVRLTAIASFVGVMLLYYIGYRRFGALLYSSAPLIAGQILTFAAAYLAFGKLNSASSGFVAMVMGLGTDFTIVMYSRYVEERRNGASLAEASRRMMGEGGLGMFTGAITSAGTFYAMCVTEFRGLWEMGFLIGTGILLSMVSIVFLLPAMIQWNEGRARKRDVIRKLHVQSFGFERLIPLAARHAGFTLLLVVALTAILGVAAWNIGFSDNIAALRSPGNAGLKAQTKLRDKFAADLNTMVAIVRATDADAAVEKARGVVDRSQRFLDGGILRDTDSLVDYLPSPADQRRLFDAFRSEESQGALNIDRVERSFRAALDAEGFREDAFDSYMSDLRSVMTRSEPITLTDLRQHDLGALLKRYVSDTTDASGRTVYQVAVYLFPQEGRWRREAPPGLAEALQGDDPDITVTGVNIVSKRLREIFARDATLAIGIGLVLVSILLWLDFRSLRLMIVANAQVLTGVVWMLGAVSLAGLQISFVNCFVATMILGVGVDYGIHLIHRMCLNGGIVDDGVLETGKGVAMAALTNLVGFGSLALSNYPGLRSVGIIAMVGSAACLMTSLTLLPALMSFKGFASAAEMHEARPVDA